MNEYSDSLYLKWLFFWLLFLLVLPADAQSPAQPVWGEADPAQFGQALALQFPEADAVVLHDYGALSLGSDAAGYRVILDRHVRIRILTEAGRYQAQQSIPYIAHSPEESESVRKIRAQTLLFREGALQALPVSNKDIRSRSAGAGWKEIQISFPEAGAGAILEYSYRLTSGNYDAPPAWPFQREIPTLISDFRFQRDKMLDYTILLIGSQTEQLQMLSENHWRMENMPPIREEPFTTTLHDNWHRLHFRLRGQRSIVGYEPALYSWQEFSGKLLQAPDLGGRLDSLHTDIQDTARELAGFFGDPERKIDILFQAVRDRITWNQEFSLFAPQPLREVWDTQKGNSAEVNLLLVYLLRAAGIAADPLLISTREHGAPIRSYPDLASFNHLICYVEWGDTGLFLDATDPLRPYLLPDSRDLNQVGWLLNQELPRWISISARPFVAMQQVYGSLAMDSTGTVTGQLSETTSGYTALAYRRALRARGESAFAQQYMQDYLPTGQVTSYQILDADLPEKPLRVEWNIRSGDFTTPIENLILLRPALMFSIEQNPLPDISRYQPVDFGHPYQSTLIFSIQLPENYEVESLPARLTTAFPNREAMLDFRCEVVAGILNIESRFLIQAPVFTAEAYLPLRSMYDQLSRKHAEKIVLRRR